MLPAADIALGILVILAITALTGYFLAQEFAYMAVDRSPLEARAEAGDNAAARALSATRRTSFMLSPLTVRWVALRLDWEPPARSAEYGQRSETPIPSS